MILSDHWYKNAIVYALDVDKFQDGNDDGVGDFQGLTHRLDYLSGLGVNCLWLLPFYPSPLRDNGYDVKDYYGVNPRYGTLGDFVSFAREAREHGIRILIDLVANHTSDEHPWFQEAREGPKSPKYDWYVWSKKKPSPHGKPVFPGEQNNTWTYDKKAKAWYLHHFYDFQPDLNMENPAVHDELRRIIGFWAELGVSGFRVDAAPYLIDDIASPSDAIKRRKAHEQLLVDLREFLDRRQGDAILLAEANVKPKKAVTYFGEGDRFQMLFNFYLNQHLYLALVREDREPLVRGLKELHTIPQHCQWAVFLRNHDELSLDQLTEAERTEVLDAMAPKKNMRIYNRGIRRRLAPLLGGDRRRIELVHSLLFTLPGTPIMRFGDEIALGEDLSLEGREPVRTVMQWSDETGAGFSSIPVKKFCVPLINDGPYANSHVNVRDQERSTDSLLNRVTQMIRLRRLSPEVGWGECRFVDIGPPALLAYVMQWKDRKLLALHNLSAKKIVVKGLKMHFADETFVDLLNGHNQKELADRVLLGPYEYRWLKSGGRGVGLALGY